MYIDVTEIENPLKSGACADCANHYKYANGKHMCAKNHIGYLTRDCAKIQICKLFHRKYRAGAPESFSNKGDVH